MKFDVKEILTGKSSHEVEVDLSYFSDCEVNEIFLNSYFNKMKASYKSERKAKTRTRSEVSGTTRKPFKQKGTGNARQGSKIASHHRGGGTMFGPRGESRHISLPKKETKLAKKMLLSSCLKDKKLIVVNDYNTGMKTKVVYDALRNISELKKNAPLKCILLGNESVVNDLKISIGNLSGVRYSSIKNITVHSLLVSSFVVITEEALKNLSAVC